jgi:hypothetical protein
MSMKFSVALVESPMGGKYTKNDVHVFFLLMPSLVFRTRIGAVFKMHMGKSKIFCS